MPIFPFKLRISDRNRVEAGTIQVGVAANADIAEGAPLTISTAGVVTETIAAGAVDSISYGPIVGNAVAGGVQVDVQTIDIGDLLQGHLLEAIPATWYGTVVGIIKGTDGFKFAIVGFLTGTNIFAIHSLKDGVVGDVGALVEVVKTA
jgi:hypothetical protein